MMIMRLAEILALQLLYKPRRARDERTFEYELASGVRGRIIPETCAIGYRCPPKYPRITYEIASVA